MYEAFAGLVLLFDQNTFISLVLGVFYGLLIGIIPGLGAGAALTLLLPFTMAMEPSTAFAAIIGLMAVNTTSDTIPAVLFGVPGETSSAATILDGHAMAKQGRAKEALGASYAASMIGGVFGALLLGVSIPIMGRLIPYIGTPELLAVCIVGLSFAASVSGRQVLKGLAAAGIGLLISFIGLSNQTGEARWTFDAMYFWDGVPLIPLVLGLFAVPTLLDMVNQPDADILAAGTGKDDSMRRGIAAAARNWFLILRSSWLGATLGAVPGIGGAVIGWIAYGSAVRSSRNPEGFGHGDVRGVIAPEGSNNARDGGALIPTLTLGVPGSAGMALVLAAFLMHGITPGPDMLRKHLDLTYMLVWGLIIANIIGATICLFFTRYLALILKIPIRYLVPAILTIVFMGAFQGSQSLGDLWLLLAVGSLAYFLRAIDWPLAPLVLGVILGEIIERYLFISLELYGWGWTLRPAPLVLLLFAGYVAIRPLFGQKPLASGGGQRSVSRRKTIAAAIFAAVAIVVIAAAMLEATQLSEAASTGPIIVGTATIALLAAVLATSVIAIRRPAVLPPTSGHVPEGSPTTDPVVLGLWLLGLMVCYAVVSYFIGMLPAIFLFVPAAFFLLGGRLSIGLPIFTLATFAFVFVLFNEILALPWPHPYFPTLQQSLVRLLQ